MVNFLNFVKSHPLCSLIIGIITLCPLFLYLWQFHDGLSSNESAWSTFGTFVGGIYSPLFTFASVIVLVATLLEINQANRKTFELSQRNNIISDITVLTKLLDNSINKKLFIVASSRVEGMNSLGNAVLTKLSASKPNTEEDIWDASIQRFDNSSQDTFRDEMPILREIMLRIHNINDEELKEQAQAIFKAIIPNDDRFWLQCYTRRYDDKTKLLLEFWSPFSSIPPQLERLLQSSSNPMFVTTGKIMNRY